MLPGANFNRRLIIYTVCTILTIEGLAMVPATLMGLYDGEQRTALGIGISAAILIIIGLVGRSLAKEHKNKIKPSESYYIVLVCWFSVVLGGMLPYLMSGSHYGLINSFFESAAGWTTTNASVVNMDEMSRALVLWSATSQWLGGMGIIMLTLIVFSALGAGGQQLAILEIGGPQLDKQTAKISDTARLLYILYGAGSLIEFVLLKVAGVPWFASLINTMSTISTSGTMDYHGMLSNHYTSAVKIIIGVFSVLASINFVLYIKIIKHRTKEAFMDYELRFFLSILVGFTAVVSLVLYIQGYYSNIFDAVVNGSTGVVSFSCTTGFPLEHVEGWPAVCKFILLVLMMIGGCSNSTCGGVKVIRFAVYLKLIARGVYKRIHTRAVKPVMIKDEPVSTKAATSIATFMMLFFAIFLMSALIFSFDNMDMETTLTAPIALFSNTGIGFGLVSGGDFSFMSPLIRLYGGILMMLGRLEIFALLIVLSRSFWRPNKVN